MFGSLKIDIALAFLPEGLKTHKERHTRFAVDPHGSFRELNETRIYSNVTEMDATIEIDTSQNTNSLTSSGYFIENYSKDDSDKENNSTNKWLPFWNLLKTK